ncbi:hypothetical protein ACFL7M_07545 [Thermodesulfobacteriota bacterium]
MFLPGLEKKQDIYEKKNVTVEEDKKKGRKRKKFVPSFAPAKGFLSPLNVEMS